MTTITYQETLQAYLSLYGDSLFSDEFDSFAEAFRDAWESFDYVTNAETPEEVAEGMCQCWQLNQV